MSAKHQAKNTSQNINKQSVKAGLRRQPKSKSQAHTKSARLPSSISLAGKAIRLLARHWAFYLVLLIVFATLNLLLVRGLGNQSNIAGLKDTFNSLFRGHLGHLTTGLTVYGFLLASSGATTNANASVYQIVLVIIMSLAIVWSLRQNMAGVSIKVREAFYFGMYPLIPVLIVLAVIALEFIPLVAGSAIYRTVTANSIAINGLERICWSIFFLILFLASLFLVVSSIFAVYIAALPNMTPLRALKSAGQLIKRRQLAVFTKLLFLIIAMLTVSAVIMVPIILFITPVAEWAFFVLTMVGLFIIHAYLYSLYRELLL